MKLSIIIPIYNVEKYLDECLTSLVSILSDINVEVICVDDGSTDRSGDILKIWLDKWPDLIIIKQKNQGLSSARNSGLKVATGKYVAFIDSDDYVDADKLIELFEVALKNDVDIAVGDYFEFNDSAAPTKANSISATLKSYIGKDFFKNYYKSLRSIIWRSVYKRSFLLENNLYFHEGVCFEDVEFTPIAFIKARHVYYSGIPFYYYRKRNNSITTSPSTIKKVKDSITVWSELSSVAESIDDSIVQSIFNELGFHCFLNQYSLLKEDIDTDDYESAVTLSRNKMFTVRYKFLAEGIYFLSHGIFHKIISKLR